MKDARCAVVVAAMLAACTAAGAGACGGHVEAGPSGSAGCGDTASDPHNCGRCGHDCLGGACRAGACQPVVLASGQNGPTDIALHAGTAYWINYGASGQGGLSTDGQVVKCPVTGCGDGPTLLASGLASPVGLAIDARNVYWGSWDGLGPVMAVALTGGLLRTLAARQTAPSSVAVDATNVYWASYDGIMSVPLGGGSPTTLASSSFSPWAIAVDATSIYWTTQSISGSVMKCAIGRCATSVTTLASPQANPSHLALDATNAYWITLAATNRPKTGAVVRCALDGCNGNPTIVASEQDYPGGIALDASNVYWTDANLCASASGPCPNQGRILRCAIDGCSNNPTVVAAGQSGPFGIAVDARSIYWTDSTGGQVMKLAK